MTTETFDCSKCGRNKPRADYHRAIYGDRKRTVPSHCKECRKEARYERAYPDLSCAQCLRHRPTQKNGVCRECNAETGLRECKTCAEVLPIMLEFQGRRSTCRTCRTSAAA